MKNDYESLRAMVEFDEAVATGHLVAITAESDGRDLARTVLTWPVEVQAKAYQLLNDAGMNLNRAARVLKEAGWTL